MVDSSKSITIDEFIASLPADEQIAIHKLAADGLRKEIKRLRRVVSAAPQCGCYHCVSIFPYADVTKWADKGKTPVCPKCGVDAVIGGELSVEMLSTLRQARFSPIKSKTSVYCDDCVSRPWTCERSGSGVELPCECCGKQTGAIWFGNPVLKASTIKYLL